MPKRLRSSYSERQILPGPNQVSEEPLWAWGEFVSRLACETSVAVLLQTALRWSAYLSHFTVCSSSGLWNFQSRLAQAFNQVLDQLGVTPLGILLARCGSEIRTERKYLLQRFLRFVAAAKLA